MVLIFSMVDEIMRNIFPIFINALKQTETQPNFGSTMICLSRTLVAISKFNTLFKNLIELLSLTEESILKILTQLAVLVKASSENQERFNSIAPEIIRGLLILSYWADMNIEIFTQNLKSKTIVNYYISSESMISAISIAIQLYVGPASDKTKLFLCNTGIADFDKAMNGMRTKYFKLGNRITEKVLYTMFILHEV